MRTIKLSLTATGAAVMLFALVGVASANRLSVSTLALSVVWSRAELTGGWGTTGCALTMEGRMQSATTTKTAGAVMGSITRASVGFCSVGSATVLRETLPWSVTYSSFAGTLPRITSINTKIIGAKWVIREPAFGIACLFTSTEARPNTATLNLSAGAVTGVTLGGEIGSDCGLNGTARGTGSNSALTITLI